MNSLSLAFCLTALVGLACGHARYQKLIPNGGSVPDPCSTGTWAGVGHMNIMGHGTLNSFGQAFASENHVWTTALCQADSDRDGVSNGEELGDPHCHWSATTGGHLRAAQGNPGICEPVGSSACAWQNFKCH